MTVVKKRMISVLMIIISLSLVFAFLKNNPITKKVTIRTDIVRDIVKDTVRDVEIVDTCTLGSRNGYEEDITIIAHREQIIDQESFAKRLIERCVANNFHEIRFSYSLRGYPNGLHITVYANETTYESGIVAFEIDYEQTEGEIYEYNIMDNPEKFQLIIR